jgi:hypothetical protein
MNKFAMPTLVTTVLLLSACGSSKAQVMFGYLMIRVSLPTALITLALLFN